jgi:hypothetical protein
MKRIAALLISTLALLTFSTSQGAERWGWSELSGPTFWPASHDDSWVPVGALSRYADAAARITIVPLSLEPAAARVPGALSAALPQLEEAVEAIRAVVAQDAALVANLKARGLSPSDVVGLTNAPSGEITLFVTGRA